jgi:GTP:adenosylcobinamide-phosphate guanylyltransferase
MQYDAILLAGGESSAALKEISPYNNEALIIIGQYPMIYYVYQSLIQSPAIRNIVISGPVEALRNLFGKNDRLFFTPSGKDAVSSFSNAIAELEQVNPTEKILILPSDIPFITSAAIEDFILRCEDIDSDLYYPLTSQEVNEKKYPGVQRTYVKLKDGTFTGGNMIMIKHLAVHDALNKARELIARRKNPVAIIRFFGPAILFKYLFNQLSIEYAEKAFSDVFSLKGKAIVTPYAEIGIDVDKPSDLELAQKHLSHIQFE